MDRLCEIFEDRKRVLVRAEFAGSGKRYACIHMQKRGHKVVFVCPTNKLCQESNDEDDDIVAVAANRFFGVGLTDESRAARFDDSEFDIVVFDEAFLLDTRSWPASKGTPKNTPKRSHWRPAIRTSWNPWSP